MKKKRMKPIIFYQIIYTFILLSKAAYSGESYSSYVNKVYPSNVYWGDTHLHTSISIDANWMGNKTLGPAEAYRFAQGKSVVAHNGMRAKLSRPSDFLVVADHAFNMGLIDSFENTDPALLKTASGRKLYKEWRKIQIISDQKLHDEKLQRFMLSKLFAFNGTKRQAVKDKKYYRAVWHQITAAADKYNEPGKFTAFIGYEWSSVGSVNYTRETGGNLHRVVVFRDDANKANKILPFSAFDSTNPEDLWSFMDDYQKKTGGEMIAIPHNGNLSNGKMFSLVDIKGNPLNINYAKKRSQWEPLYEVTQTKGTSEVHPLLSPIDEFSDYEIWDSWPWQKQSLANLTKAELIKRKKAEYARSALKAGLNLQARLSVNPFKFGIIGSTDSHTSLSTADDNNFWGKFSYTEPNAERLSHLRGYAASGYAGIWAEENTRESLFSALRRKEVYATTGPRIRLRFFGGWNYVKEDALRPEFARIGYSKGVPMGGDLTDPPNDKSPTFLIRAVRDPDGANLDRIQVIKGWRTKDGELHEKIYNVALSDGRKESKFGKVNTLDSTVDLQKASYTNKIGNPELSVVWQDPSFKREELAFYYVRVLQIPTPRWNAYDVKFFRLKDNPTEESMVTQERAYSSPIWYSPPD